MSRKKISTTIYVTPEQNDRLKLLHDRTKVPVAVYIREGIDLVLRHYAHLLPGQLALDVTPPPGQVAALGTNTQPPLAFGDLGSAERGERGERNALDGSALTTPALIVDEESAPLPTRAQPGDLETAAASGKKSG
jgi:hypothetical protein